MTKTTNVLRVAVGLTLAAVFGCAIHPAAQAQTFSVVYSFGATATDGLGPLGQLVIDASGNLYGTTVNGGSGGTCPRCGTIFEIDASGDETVLYNFTGGTDGGEPVAGVFRDPAGSLYGTANRGGDLTTPCTGGCGTVFKLDADGKLTTLHMFGLGEDGQSPMGRLISFNGELYGTTRGGSDFGCCGTIFKISKTGDYHLLHRFTGDLGGVDPNGRLVSDSKGNLYGTTADGGSSTGGTIFKLDTANKLTFLFSFPLRIGSQGALPQDAIRDVNGNFHGATSWGGNLKCSSVGCGVVFRVSSTGTETVLHTFGTAADDGRNPQARLVDAGGVLYGTTSAGGILSGCGGAGCGTVFRIARDGKYTVLYRFTGGADGANPGELTLDAAGNLYGVASGGGEHHGGVVFKIAP
jgi:uncharacterized repeat protein (TIGR03803 family)